MAGGRGGEAGDQAVRLPLVLGTWAARRGSSWVAISRARASALKTASSRWWSFRPASTRTWREKRPACASDSRKCRHRSEVDGAGRRAAQPQVADRIAPSTEVHGDLGECLVQRNERIGHASDAQMRSECLVEGLTECKRHVLDGVVRVNFQIATRPHGQVKQAVAAKLRQHVIEKRQARLRRHRAAPIEAQ